MIVVRASCYQASPNPASHAMLIYPVDSIHDLKLALSVACLVHSIRETAHSGGPVLTVSMSEECVSG